MVFLVPNLVLGASTIFLIPTQVTYSIAREFDITVKLNTRGQLVDKVEGGISFDNSILVVKSISTTESDVDFWLVEPTFLNNKGKISFVAGMENKKGDDLNLFSISFTSLKIGITEVNVSYGQVFSIDNNVGNIAGALASSVITIANPLTYNLEPSEQINPYSPAPANNVEVQIKVAAIELLYRLLLIILVLLVLSLSWWVNKRQKGNKQKSLSKFD